MRRRIIELLELDSSLSVWEIGPGLGAMSEDLAVECGGLILFEIDRRFAEYLRGVFGGREHVRVVEGDFLKTWEEILTETGVPDRVLGNLPYNAASQIIAALIESETLRKFSREEIVQEKKAPRMVFTVQKEVGQRMMAPPGGKDYSSFSVLCGLYAHVSDCGDVAAGSFHPVPNVVSKVVVVEPHDKYDPSLRRRASAIAKDAFASRRKTLRNTMKSGSLARRYDPSLLIGAVEEAAIDPGVRGESLCVEEFVEIARAFSAMERKRTNREPENKRGLT